MKEEFSFNKLISNFLVWANEHEDIRGAIIVGSRARTETPADKWSDLDLVIAADNPQKYLCTTEWLKNIGEYWITFIEDTAVGEGKERRVLFDNGLDVDFSIFSVEGFKQISAAPEVQEVLSRGMKIILDKDNLFKDLETIPKIASKYKFPSEEYFLNFVNDFWYHTVWTAKKLLRGEIWMAKACMDGYMRSRLEGLIECHAKACNGVDYDTWHSGRFLDKWADARIAEELEGVFAHYDKEDMKRALPAMMNLFSWLAKETAEKLNYSYTKNEEEKAMGYVKFLFETN